jgi:hypothetical protein
MVNFAHASVKEAVGGPSLGELRPLIRTPNGGGNSSRVFLVLDTVKHRRV